MTDCCQWPIDRSCLPELPADTSGADYEAQLARREAAEDLAVSIMWALSGRQFGVCPYIVRPCTQSAGYWRTGTYGTYGYVAYWDVDHWITASCGCGIGRCRTSGPSAVHLPGPAQDVEEVLVEGEPLDPDLYRLEGDVLHRIGGAWPAQDLSQPMGEANTWSVEYLRGNPVPRGAAFLTGLLTKELINACTGAPCRLPRTVTSVNRQGLSFNLDPSVIYAAGKTGISEIDTWLAAVNPNKLLCAPSVI